jgi:hypothetical protein
VAFNSTTCPEWWKEANGNGTIDLRWTFIRWLNWDENWRDVERSLWNYQEDTLQGFATLTENSMPYGGRSGGYLVGIDTFNGRSKYWQEYSLPVANNHGTPRLSNETRPKNIVLLYCIKE